MKSSFSISLGNYLFRNFFPLYKILYWQFKKWQDAKEIYLIKKSVKPGDIVFDIGVNIGFYSDLLVKCTGEQGEVHAFEPDRTNFNYLRKQTSLKENVINNNRAVGAASGILKFYTSPKLNVDHRTYRPDEYKEEQEVDACSIDDYLESMPNHKGSVDFIKMDIQGFEMEALKGMFKTIERNPKLKIISEFWPYGLNKAGSSATEYFLSLKSLGFEISLIEKQGMTDMKIEKVRTMEGMEEDYYCNIFISKMMFKTI